MTETIFNINILSNTLEKNNLDNSQTNCYLYLTFFLERCQFISNIIKILKKDVKNSFAIGIKYCVLNEINNEKIIRKIKEFKSEFEKNELIYELLNFIKNTINERKIELIKMDTSSEKLLKIFNSSSNLKNLINELDNLGVEDNEIYEFIQSEYVNKIDCLFIDDEIFLLDKNWLNNNKQNEIYKILKNWFPL